MWHLVHSQHELRQRLSGGDPAERHCTRVQAPLVPSVAAQSKGSKALPTETTSGL